MSRQKTDIQDESVNSKSRGMLPGLSFKLSFAIFVVLSLSIFLTTSLNYLNFDKRLTETTDSKYKVVMQETLSDINNAIAFGVPLHGISNVQSLLERHLASVSGLIALEVTDRQTERLYFANHAEVSIAESQTKQLRTPIYNAFGQLDGEISLTYSLEHLGSLRSGLISKSAFYAVIWIVIATLCNLIFIHGITKHMLRRTSEVDQCLSSQEIAGCKFELASQIMEGNQQHLTRWQKFRQRHTTMLILVLAFTTTFVANFMTSLQMMDYFADIYQQELNEKASIIAYSLVQLLDYLIASGFDVANLRGLDSELANYLVNHNDIIAISIVQESQTLVNAGAQFDELQLNTHLFPLNNHDTIALTISSDKNLVATLLKENLLDMLSILVASLLVVTEVILFLCNYMIMSPWHQLKQLVARLSKGFTDTTAKVTSRDEISSLLAKINRTTLAENTSQTSIIEHQNYRFVRLPLFLFVFAEAASLSFFPNYVSTLVMDVSWIPLSMQASFPISLFMLVWAISLPFAGYWSDKLGRRKALIIGGLVITVGMVSTSLCNTLSAMLLSRTITALGYGLVFISAQGFVSDYTDNSNRTKGMATFLSSFFSGSLCGAAIGGLLADRIGYSGTFFLASGISIVGVLLVWRFFEQGDNNQSSVPIKLSDFSDLLSNKHFALISFCSAIPAKVVLTGFLYYLCPVYLQHLGESNAMSGRILMIYGLAIVVISPLTAIWIDRFKNKLVFVVIGGLLSSFALLNIYYFNGTLGLLVVVLVVGIAHSIGISPQIPLVMSLMKVSTSERGKAIGIFRLTERIGNVTGPILTGALLGIYGFISTVMILGGLLFVSTISLVLVYYFWQKKDKIFSDVEGASA
ncbi:MFS transporter [Vibrio sp. SCSIO 43133]|uniref:MFS transporter n=1 Tax=Vibrio sp. SCSIO 43133 TaxID=2802577 RepID=UPI0020762429|nr:MFS transporter [Vibrio sp. SCSIO 43133]USD99220.1 MFS transporter [Vibrio sp. SCSIO 43133]